VIKVGTRTELAGRWPGLTDIDAGKIITGRASVEGRGWELSHDYLDVSSRRKRPWVEAHGLHSDQTLFDTAPTT